MSRPDWCGCKSITTKTTLDLGHAPLRGLDVLRGPLRARRGVEGRPVPRGRTAPRPACRSPAATYPPRPRARASLTSVSHVVESASSARRAPEKPAHGDHPRRARGRPRRSVLLRRLVFQPAREPFGVGMPDQRLRRRVPSPSRAARHIASGSSSTTVSFRIAGISVPAALRIVRSRIRPVRVERMTMPSKTASPEGSTSGVSSFEIGLATQQR